jgi:hypothetical protein
MSVNETTAAKYQESFGAEFVQNSKFHINLSQEVIVITEDRFRLCLQSHADRLTAKERWVAPVSLLIALGIVFPTAEFKQFVLPSATWQAIFVICTAGAAVWSAVSIWRAIGTDSKLDTLVREVKRNSDQLTSTGNER